MSSFEQSYKLLNKQQKEAVDSIDGPVLVIAGPGTGKTQLLSTRVANILNKTDADAANILCLTFTNKAAANMRERLNQLIGPASRKVVVRTFHSLSAEVINQYSENFFSGAKLSVAPDLVQDDIIESILSSLPLDSPLAKTFNGQYTAMSDIKTALRLAKEAGLLPHELKETLQQNLNYIDSIEPKLKDILSAPLSYKKLEDLAQKIEALPSQDTKKVGLLKPLDMVIKQALRLAIEADNDTSKTKNTGKFKARFIQSRSGEKGMYKERERNEWWLEVCDVYQSYRQELHARGYYDYSDMLVEVIDKLQNNEDMLADLQEQFQYILIDEFQDTNAAQFRLAQLIADSYASNGKPNLMAVGDDDQSIFAFNGAELSNMLQFKDNYPSSRIICLEQNYRSTQTILDASKQIIEQADERLVNKSPDISKNLISNSASPKSSKVEHLRFPTQAHQQVSVAKKISQLWEAGETDIAVIARTNQSLRQIATILNSLDVPISYEQQENVLENPAVEQITLIAQAAVYIADGDLKNANFYISRLLRHPMWNIKPQKLWSLAIDNFGSRDWYSNLLENSDPRLNTLGEWLASLARQSDETPLPIILDEIIGMPNEKPTIFRSPIYEQFIGRDASNKIDRVKTLSAISQLRSAVHEFASKGNKLSDFVRFIELSNANERVFSDESWFVSGERAVQLLSVHKSKGLEFDYVFLIDAVESGWQPKANRRKSPANLSLQPYGEVYDDYIRLLYVAITRARHTFVATSFASKESEKEILATPLLAGLPLNIQDEELVDATETLVENLRWPTLSAKNMRTQLANRLENFQLSASALQDYVDIERAGPTNFLERQLLRLPTQHSAQGSFGTAIHDALQTACELINRDQLNTNTVLDKFEASLKSKMLHPNDFTKYLKKGENLLPKILEKHDLFIQKDSKSERKFEQITLGKAKLKGSIDLLQISDSEIIISDYKTGKPLPSFETKDKTLQTKAWRYKLQLMFYTLLIKNSNLYKNQKITTRMVFLEADEERNLIVNCTIEDRDLANLEKLIGKVWVKIQKLDFVDVSRYSGDYNGIKDFEDDLLSGKI